MDFHKDDQLIIQVQKGDKEAFDTLYLKYYKPLFYTAYRLTNNIEDAKDAVQAAFMQMYKSIGNLKEPQYFRLWMNKIVRGKCIDMFQKNKDLILDVSQDEVINFYAEEKGENIPHENYRFVADRDILMKLIRELPNHYQEILVYAYFSQFTMKEMADILEIPEGTVKSRLYAAKKALKDKVMTYETNNHYKITFRLPGMLPLSLMLAYRNEAKTMNASQRMKLGRESKGLIAALAVLVLGLGAAVPLVKGSLFDRNQEEIKESTTNAVSNTVKGSEQEAYFMLKNWAADEVQMSEKTKEEIALIQPYYDLLEEKQGPYWQRLQKDQWNAAFEELKNSK